MGCDILPPNIFLKHVGSQIWLFVGLGEVLLKAKRQGTLYLGILTVVQLYTPGRPLRGSLTRGAS